MNEHIFRIRWSDSMGSYRVSIPMFDEASEGVEVVRLDALRAKLAEMELFDDLPDSFDLGYMAAWREIDAFLKQPSAADGAVRDA